MSKNISIVVERDLCVGCGACVGICPNHCMRLSLNKRTGLWNPIIQGTECTYCGTCLAICPGIDADYDKLLPREWGAELHHSRFGAYSQLAISFSQNQIIHANGSSGGLATAILIHMLRTHIIDGAVVAIMGRAPTYFSNFETSINPSLMGRAIIARSEHDILRAQSSKYCPVPVAEILDSLKSASGRFAFVGLPCHIHALRKWQHVDNTMYDKIPFCVGLFCSRTPSFHATKYLLHNRGIDPKNVTKINYRSGSKHLGYMEIVLKDETVVEVPHLDFDYWRHMFMNFFMPHRCYLCPDKLAALADISLGDNWTRHCNLSLGTSTVVVRAPKMLSLLNEMSSQRLIYLRDIGFEALAISQDLANKTHILPRKLVCRILSKSTPNYGNLNTHFDRDNISLFNILKALKLHLNCRISNGYIGYSFLSRLGKISLLIDNVSKKTANMISLVFKAFKLMFGYLLCFAPTKAPRLSKRSKYKILMIGGYGSKDIGDEAMPHADVMNLRKSFGDDLEIVMLSPDPQNTTKTHKAKSIQDIPELGFSSGTDVTSKLENILSALYGLAFLLATALSHRGIHLRLWPNARSILNELKASDMVFNVGGGNLNSIIPQELYKKGLIYLSAMILHKPVVLSGQTIGPFENNMDRRFAQLSLNSVDSIYFRDKGISQQRCHEIGIFKPRMVDAADDAMTIPFIKKEKAKKLLLLEAGQKWHHMKSQLAVAMNFKGSLRLFRKRGKLSDLSRECQLMAEIADAMVTIFRAKILFIPTDYSTGVDDRDLHQEIIRKTRHSESIGAIEGEYDDTTLKGLIGLFDIAIGSRYHFCVFAASMLVPFAGLASGTYQKTKLKGLSELCDLPNCFIEKDMATAKFNEVWPNIKWVMDNKCFIKNRLAQMVPLLNTRSLYGVERAVKLMRTA